MADWDQHRDELKRLYLNDGKSVKEVKAYMVNTYGFHKTNFQYESQFNKWNWQKKLTEKEWQYIGRKKRCRGESGLDSTVIVNGFVLPKAKVEKGVSRYMHPNSLYASGPLPPSPQNIVVSMPLASNAWDFVPGWQEMRRGEKDLHQETLGLKRQRLNSQPFTKHEVLSDSFVDSALQATITRRSLQRTPRVIDIKDIPYFKFVGAWDPDVVKRGFEKILDEEGLIPQFWPQRVLPPGNLQWSDSHNLTSELDLDVEIFSTIPNSPFQLTPTQAYKGFGSVLCETVIGPEGDAYDMLIHSATESRHLLASVPRMAARSLDADVELLQGPPTAEAARFFVQVGVYLTSNNLYRERCEALIHWILWNVDWQILRPLLLSTTLSALHVFAQAVLLEATKTDSSKVVKDLLESPPLQKFVKVSLEPLYAAVRRSNGDLVALLLRAGAKPNAQSERNGSLPLHFAQTVEVAKMLIAAGADVNALGREWWGWREAFVGSPLMGAVARGNSELVQYLISAGASVQIAAKATSCCGSDWGRATMLLIAATDGDGELVKLLLRAGAEVNEISTAASTLPYIQKGGTTALQSAAYCGNLEIVKILLEGHADPNAGAYVEEGTTALQIATADTNIAMVKLLLEYNADPNILGPNSGEYPSSALLTAVERNHIELVKILLIAGADIYALPFRCYGSTLLEAVKAQANSEDIAELLLATFVSVRDVQKSTIHPKQQLYQAIEKADLQRIRYLISLGTEINIAMINRWASCRGFYRDIHRSCSRCKTDIIQILLPYIKDFSSEPEFKHILFKVIATGNVELLEALEKTRINLNIIYDGITPLMEAVCRGLWDPAMFFLNKGVNVNAVVSDPKQEDFTTALQASMHYACRFCASNNIHHWDLFHLLRDHGARINGPVAEIGGRSELAYAVESNDMEMVRHLLAIGAKVNTRPAKCDGMTPLRAAAYIGNNDIIQLLLDNGAEIDAPASEKYGWTALQAASERGYFNTVHLLLEAGADVNAGSKERGLTSLESAAKKGRLDVVHLLLEAGADEHLSPGDRYTSAAEDAWDGKHLIVVKLLIDWKERMGPGSYSFTEFCNVMEERDKDMEAETS